MLVRPASKKIRDLLRRRASESETLAPHRTHRTCTVGSRCQDVWNGLHALPIHLQNFDSHRTIQHPHRLLLTSVLPTPVLSAPRSAQPKPTQPIPSIDCYSSYCVTTRTNHRTNILRVLHKISPCSWPLPGRPPSSSSPPRPSPSPPPPWLRPSKPCRSRRSRRTQRRPRA